MQDEQTPSSPVGPSQGVVDPQLSQHAYAQQSPQPPIQTPQPMLTPKSSKPWVKWLILWLCAFPLAFLLGLVIQFLFQFGSRNPIKVLLSLVSVLAGMYGVLGWIPLVISVARNQKS